ncbi:hypothetical protein CC78DRAFT_235378 [Lojkania enalia]|uniref:Uncharacterized protein n=1 Tax=Lojkania enalia TaxID=147567 RepID=A0A9P4K9Z5_9PLEO|nr:hypothetical protein CC78DRAFT_235378 [Didymosphaeria enalia]
MDVRSRLTLSKLISPIALNNNNSTQSTLHKSPSIILSTRPKESRRTPDNYPGHSPCDPLVERCGRTASTGCSILHLPRSALYLLGPPAVVAYSNPGF